MVVVFKKRKVWDEEIIKSVQLEIEINEIIEIIEIIIKTESFISRHVSLHFNLPSNTVTTISCIATRVIPSNTSTSFIAVASN